MIHGIGTVGRDLHLEDGVVAFAGNTFHGDARKSKFVRKPSVVDSEGQRSRAANEEKFSFYRF